VGNSYSVIGARGAKEFALGFGLRSRFLPKIIIKQGVLNE